MTDVMSPDAFKVEARRLIAEILKLAEEYEHGHGAAYSPQDMESVKVTTTADNGVPFSMALAQQQLRGELAKACALIRLLRVGKKSAKGTILSVGVEMQLDWITSALERGEHRHGVEFDAVRNPRSLSADGSEHRELMAAQRRRRSRGEIA